MGLKSLLMAVAAAATIGGACCVCSGSAQASTTLLWTFTGTFDDGGSVSGYFTWTEYNALSSAAGSLDATSTAGSNLGGDTYFIPGSFPNGGVPANALDITNGYFDNLEITFEYPLTTPGIDPILIGATSFECYAFSCPGPDTGQPGQDTRYFTGGYAATPLPGSLPLFGSVLGGLYLISWFRRRRVMGQEA